MKPVNLALDCKEFDDYLVDTYSDTINNVTGCHYIFRFPNSFGASVVKTYDSIGSTNDKWELCVILFEKENVLGPDDYLLVYPSEICDKRLPIGNLTDKEIRDILLKIKNL